MRFARSKKVQLESNRANPRAAIKFGCQTFFGRRFRLQADKYLPDIWPID